MKAIGIFMLRDNKVRKVCRVIPLVVFVIIRRWTGSLSGEWGCGLWDGWVADFTGVFWFDEGCFWIIAGVVGDFCTF